jgi:hypothetical protein
VLSEEDNVMEVEVLSEEDNVMEVEVLSEEDNVEMVEGGMLQEVSASCTSIQPSDDEGCNQVADLPTTTSEVKEFTSAKTPHLSRK